jgi:Caspase domain
MPRKLALLVGNGIYDNQKYTYLAKSAEDVHALAEVLRNPNTGAFDNIQELIDEPENTIRQTIDIFFAEKKRDDLLLLYLTGHGDIDRQSEWYFICRDTKPGQLFSTAISAGIIRKIMENCRSDQQIIILDSCYGGAFFEGSKGAIAVEESIKNQLTGRGRVVLAATSATQLAWEGDQPTSIFTSYLVQGIQTGEADKNKDGYITVDDWFEYASEQVREETANQTPTKWVSKQQGSIVVAKNPFFNVDTYRIAVKKAWADKNLSKEKIVQLTGLASDLGLSEEQIASVEHGEMGDLKETIWSSQVTLEHLAQYRRAVEAVWVNKRLDEVKITYLRTLANELHLSDEHAAAIEQEVMGNVKERVFQRQLERDQQDRSRGEFQRLIKEQPSPMPSQTLSPPPSLGVVQPYPSKPVVEQEVMDDVKESPLQHQLELARQAKTKTNHLPMVEYLLLFLINFLSIFVISAYLLHSLLVPGGVLLGGLIFTVLGIRFLKKDVRFLDQSLANLFMPLITCTIAWGYVGSLYSESLVIIVAVLSLFINFGLAFISGKLIK